ncbi:uncharacterized protein LOC130366965 isoform X1 [Hyla sarda]|uniref:uncharacterized protein LOC130366965 isoform X1 n=1 Tax=Hyla sarda TaxID=327740 RepID=UPI0024C2778F|nr:uncharacterized protein LOC130366965 isoform X1 [Hyla sarda]XP_056425327.1 uncharacterized protein LOC130366965 isoform X1 [Hyla sarda]XP_056425328.1 uncharacterized protein LOC130366965 isoform X1 [Hyla sarda]
MAPLPPPGPPSKPLHSPSPDTADQGQEDSPLPASSLFRPNRQRIEVSLGDLVRPLGTGRRQQGTLEDLIKLTKESFMRLDDRVEALREEFCWSRQAGAGPSTGPPSDVLLHLQSLAPFVEKLPFEKQFQFRKESTDLVLRLCCPTPDTPSPPHNSTKPADPPPPYHSPYLHIFPTPSSPGRHRSPSLHRSPARHRTTTSQRSRSRHCSPARHRSPAHHRSSHRSRSHTLPHSLGTPQHFGPTSTPSNSMVQMLSQGEPSSFSTPSFTPLPNFPLPPNIPTPVTPFQQYSFTHPNSVETPRVYP